jgi:hypothetical protein
VKLKAIDPYRVKHTFLKKTLVAAGNFIPTSGINVTGSAKIYLNGNQNEVRLENFSVSNCPDLKVYLSKRYPTDFVNLGNLTSSKCMQFQHK